MSHHLGLNALNRQAFTYALGVAMFGLFGQATCSAATLSKSGRAVVTVSAQVIDTCTVSTKPSTLGVKTGCAFGSAYMVTDAELPISLDATTADVGTNIRRVTVTF